MNHLAEVTHPIERRKDASAALIHLIEGLQESVHKLSEDFHSHKMGLEEIRADIIAKLLTESFPDGNHHEHRRYHESLIKIAEDKAAFWKKMREEIGKWGLLGLLGWAAMSVWHTFLQGPK